MKTFNFKNDLMQNFIFIISIPLILYIYWLEKKNKEKNEIVDSQTEEVPMTNKNYTYSAPTPPKQKNFSLNEFKCSDGTPVPPAYYGNAQFLMNQLQVIRDHVGSTIKINSGYRTQSYNQKIGGVSNSMHLFAKAADIQAPAISSLQLVKIIMKLIDQKKIHDGGIGLYDGFIHYDVGTSRRWNNSKYKAWQ